MRIVRCSFSFAFVFHACALLAQTSVPLLVQPIPAQSLAPGSGAVTLDLRNHFGLPGVVGTEFAIFTTVFGRFGVELRPDAAPQHVANFLTYVQAGDYTNSFFHRGASFDGAPTSSIIQGGGFRLPLATEIARRGPVPLEYNLPNARGTLAAARTTDINSATSEWYFNVIDNSATLGPANGGGYTVFGRVLGSGISVIDAIAALPRVNAGSVFATLPLRDFAGGQVQESHLALVNSIVRATLFPTGSGGSVLEFSVQNSGPAVVATALSGSTLTITPVSPGAANVVVRVTDVNGNAAQGSFTATVASGVPVFTLQPVSQTVAAGNTVVFHAPATGAASFQWERNGVPLPGATSSTLVIKGASAADVGTYVNVATNSVDTVRSAPAILTVTNLPPTAVGRLSNLSILTRAGSGARVLTMGAVVGPAEFSEALPLLIRAVGPTLAQPPFSVGGVLPDPVLTLYAADSSTPLETNDNWGGAPALVNAFQSVAAFALPADSLDSAMLRAAPGLAPGAYTVTVTGKGETSGNVIAELYDASAAARTASTPRLINLSTLGEIDPGADLAVGFVIGGLSARTVLVRGVGPSLGQFEGLVGMTDPRLALFDNSTGQQIAANDDWAGRPEIAAAAQAVAAFPLIDGDSKDAVVLLTLPPGQYSARVEGANDTGGTAIVEVYEIP